MKKPKKQKLKSLRPFMDTVLTNLARYAMQQHVWNEADQERMADVFDEIEQFHNDAVKKAYEQGKAEQSLFFGERAEA